MKSSLVILLCVVLLFSLLSPQVEGAVGRVGRRVGGGRRIGRGQGRRRIPVKRRKGRWSDDDVQVDNNAAENDVALPADEASTKDAGAVEAAGALGDLAGICEILMFDRGEGTYSLKFIKNC